MKKTSRTNQPEHTLSTVREFSMESRPSAINTFLQLFQTYASKGRDQVLPCPI